MRESKRWVVPALCPRMQWKNRPLLSLSWQFLFNPWSCPNPDIVRKHHARNHSSQDIGKMMGSQVNPGPANRHGRTEKTPTEPAIGKSKNAEKSKSAGRVSGRKRVVIVLKEQPFSV